jgi:alpha-mannosidase
MASWPLFPNIKFSSCHSYFDTIKSLKDSFPLFENELNFVFPGCYTTQTRIKAGNRLSEAALFEVEALAALSPAGKTDPALFEEVWRDVLFNQFHDIIPGSGVPDTREHARGLFQETLAMANSQKSIVCYAISDLVDTSSVGGGRNITEAYSEGAGVGFGVERGYSLSQVERGTGLRRGYLLFNTAGERADTAMLTVWDWPGDRKALKITDSAGTPLSFQILDDNQPFWGHHRTEIAVMCKIPSMGWQLVIIDEDADTPMFIPFEIKAPRVHTPYEYVLENDILRAELNPASGTIQTLIDKRTGKTVAVNGGFFGLTESTVSDYPAWIIGRYKNDEEPCIIDSIEWLHKGDVRNAVKVIGHYRDSKITYVISLDKGAEYLAFNTEVDWLQPGFRETGMPQLHFKINQASPSKNYLYDIPFGWIKRPSMDLDVPGLTCVCSCPETTGNPALAIVSRDKYGYRCFNDMMSLTLIHSSYRPDPFPELGRHNFTFYLAVPEPLPSCLNALSMRLCHPVFTQSVTPHKGTLPPVHSLFQCNAAISGIKLAEDNSGDIIIRLYDEKENDHDATVVLAVNIESAHLCSITEAALSPLLVSGNKVTVPLKKNGCATIRFKRKAD